MLELLGVDDLFLKDSPRSQISGDDEAYLEEHMDANAAANMINKVINGLEDDAPKRKRIRLSKKRMGEIPAFDIEDILGDFEVDNNANNMIIKTKDGKLNDKFGRLVNRRGYFVDEHGNVVTHKGLFIFHAEEIDDDDEIPAPFCFEKRKKRIFKVQAFS